MQPGSCGADDDVDHIGADPQVESQQEIFQQQPQQQQNHPMLYQSDHHNQASMDEFLDNIISMPSWSEVGALRNQWDYNAAAMFKTSLMSCQDASSNEHVGNVQFSSENDMLVVPFQNQLGVSTLQNSELASLHGISDDMMVVQAHVQGSAGANVAPFPAVIARGGAAANLARSLSVGSSASEGSQQQQPVLDSQSPPAWCQQFVQALPLSLGGQSKLEGTTSDPTSVKKRYRDEEQGQLRDHRSTSLGREGAQVYGGAPQVGQMQVTRASSQPSQPSQQQSAPGQAYAGAVAASNLATAGVARPRMRARRGQATDPHSIAERLRRERIAERMKALQELVPNANKTDKASMLDEIIDYVKFLQLQVKVLSMSRLGGAGAVAPLVADLPSEGAQSLLATTVTRSSGSVPAVSQEGIALTERQVARLMEEDMGSAMQYLQSKGLCLMPISLATAISSTSSKASMVMAGTLQQATPISEDKLPVSGINSSMSLGIMPSAIGTGSITANGGNAKEKEKSCVTTAIESTLQTL